MHHTEKDRLLALIRKYEQHAFMATIDEGQPFIRPIAPYVDDDLSIFVVTFRSSRKVAHILKHDRVCMLFADTLKWSQQAIVYASAAVSVEPRETDMVWKIRNEDLIHYFPNGPQSPEFCLIKLRISHIEYYEAAGEDLKVWINSD